jgi:hypothetical protein
MILLGLLAYKGDVTFLDEEYRVPLGCKTLSGHDVECKSYSVQWVYPEAATMASIGKLATDQVGSDKLDFTSSHIPCTIAGIPAEAFWYRYRANDGMKCGLVAFGVVDGRGVLIKLTGNSDFESPTELPGFVTNLVRFR